MFASGARKATSSIPVPSTQAPVPTTGHSTQVIDVEQAAQVTVAEGLDRLIADYGSGSDDADASEKSPEEEEEVVFTRDNRGGSAQHGGD